MCDEDTSFEPEFCFNEWAEYHGLTRATTGVLVKEGCNSKEILEVLSSSAVNKLGLSIGQGIAFRKGLKALGNRAGGKQTDAMIDSPQGNVSKRRREEDLLAQDSQPPSGQRFHGGALEQEVEKELDDYLKHPDKGAEEGLAGHSADHTGAAYGTDPRVNLVIKSQKRKAQKITNFLPESVTKRMAAKGKDKMALVQGPDGKLSIKSDDELPTHLTLSEWGAANLRLMQHLLDSGELSRSDIEYYNAYTLMVFEMIENYEWASILAFDTRYRELQAHTGFPWGTPTRGLEVSTLIPRVKKERQSERARTRNSQKGEKKGICRAFARDGTCSYGERCIFAHRSARNEGSKNGPGGEQSQAH